MNKYLFSSLLIGAALASWLGWPHPTHQATGSGTQAVLPASTAAEAAAPAETIAPTGTPEAAAPAYPFGNPAGCAANQAAAGRTPAEMLANVQAQLAENLAERRQTYIWHGPSGSYVDVTQDEFAYEYVFDSYQPSTTYLGDRTATVFLNNGFAVWFRNYGGHFRLLAVPMVDGVLASRWADYVTTYWDTEAQPADETIYPVLRKLPCHWMIDAGYAEVNQVELMFNLDWQIPDYTTAGRKYLAEGCKAANEVSQNQIGYWDATSMCGPLTWQILKDTNSFPYRIGSWYASARAFTQANPKHNAQPWATFDPETFDLIRVETPMPGYDFERYGHLYKGDVLFSYGPLWGRPGEETQFFSHIFMVTDVRADGARMSVTNLVQNWPVEDCHIREVVLYTPGDRYKGFMNHEWNGYGFGKTGNEGFDIFRWKWVTYHAQGQPISYTVRWGDTLETVGFDWKVDPAAIAAANGLALDAQLVPGQALTLPALSEEVGFMK